MSSKAKSGLSATRAYWEDIAVPPNTFVVGATSFTTKGRDGKGHAAVHASVTNDTPGTLNIYQAWQRLGPYVLTDAIVTGVDPGGTGLQIADAVVPVIRRYVKVQFLPSTSLGANFELGAYFTPRSDSDFLEMSGGVPTPPPVLVSSSLTGVKQVQNIETTTPLIAGATFTGGGRDCLNFESFGISVFVTPIGGQAVNATVLVQNSSDGGVTFRTVDSIPLSGAVGASVNLNRTYSVCRRHYQVSITNNDGVNALAATEVVSMQKPI